MSHSTWELDAHVDVAADSDRDADIDAIVSRAAPAQESFANWTDARVDSLLRDLANAFAGKAEELAAATVAETGLGNVEDKVLKNRFAGTAIFESTAGKVTQGQIGYDPHRQVADLASPVGVVFAVVPITNPVETAIFKALIALKTRNALIVSFPRQASGVGRLTIGIAHDVLAAHRAPIDVLQLADLEPRRATTRRFMSHPGVALVFASPAQACSSPTAARTRWARTSKTGTSTPSADRLVTICPVFSLEQVRRGARLTVLLTEEIAKKDAFRQCFTSHRGNERPSSSWPSVRATRPSPADCASARTRSRPISPASSSVSVRRTARRRWPPRSGAACSAPA